MAINEKQIRQLMCKRQIIVYLSVFIFICYMQVAVAKAQAGLSEPLQQIITQNKAEDAFWSITVRDSSGKIIEAYNSQKLMRPASNLKLLTAATVLDELGADFTYKTYMYGVGDQKQDVWDGNIIIRGMGDPSMSGRFYNDDRLFVLEKFYSALQAMGIKKISGNIIGNDSYFDEKPYPDGWSWDDLSFYYAVPISALSFNNNTVDLTVYANGGVGNTPKIEWFPFDTDYVNFINEQSITPKNAEYDEYYRRLLGTNTIILRSSLPQGYVEKEALSIQNPPLYFLDTIKKYLEDGGIAVEGDIILDSQIHNWANPRYKVLEVHESYPLKDLMQQLNKESDNFYAEMLLKTAAAERYNTQGTTDLGIALATNFARSQGLDVSKISMSDASGLSPKSLISTGDLSLLLASMQTHRAFEAFKNSLSEAGIDGSLKHRFQRGPLTGRLLAKTGYVSGVRTLSGYLTTSSSKRLSFSFATNHYTTTTSYVDSLHETLLEKLYTRY